MSSLEISQVSNLLLEFHPEASTLGAAKIILDFDKWSLITYSVGMLGRCNWWYWDANPQLAQLIRDGRPSVTVEEAGKRYLILGKEIFNCDKGFGAKVDGIVDFVGRAGVLPPMIAVKGRNPFSTPSIIEGNHRSLAILVAYLQGKIEVGKRYRVMVGRKSFLGL